MKLKRIVFGSPYYFQDRCTGVWNMLNYHETNWKSDGGLETHRYEIIFEDINSESTIEEQKKRPERLSLVKFFENNERRRFIEICRLFHEDDEHFYFDENKRFHSTLLGFPVVESEYYDVITQQVKQFTEETHLEMMIKFDVIRLGTKYENNNNLKPVKGTSNGTLIALGDTIRNKAFTTFGNNLASVLTKDEDLNPVLGKNFRRRFPTVWCTMGHYTKNFKIMGKLEALFNEYLNLESSYFESPCHELELGKSCYKDLRDWKSISKFCIKL